MTKAKVKLGNGLIKVSWQGLYRIKHFGARYRLKTKDDNNFYYLATPESLKLDVNTDKVLSSEIEVEVNFSYRDRFYELTFESSSLSLKAILASPISIMVQEKSFLGIGPKNYSLEASPELFISREDVAQALAQALSESDKL